MRHRKIRDKPTIQPTSNERWTWISFLTIHQVLPHTFSIISLLLLLGPNVASCLVDFLHRWATLGTAATLVFWGRVPSPTMESSEMETKRDVDDDGAVAARDRGEKDSVVEDRRPRAITNSAEDKKCILMFLSSGYSVICAFECSE